MATNTALNFKWGSGLTQNNPAYSQGTIYVAYDEKAMYVDAPDGRIRLGDFITCTYEELIAKPADWTETALYYISDKNALAKWNPKGGENGTGAWTIINDTSGLEALIGSNTAAIGVNAGAITALQQEVGTAYEANKESNEYKESVLGRLDAIEMSVGSGGSVEDRFAAVEERVSDLEETLNGTEDIPGLVETVENLTKENGVIAGIQSDITELETAVSQKASQTDFNSLSGTVEDLTQTVANNKTAAEEAIQGVAGDLAEYEESNNAALKSVSDKANANESAITGLLAKDVTLQENINKVDAKFADYVTTTTHSSDVSRLEGLISSNTTLAQKGVDDAKAADNKAVSAGNAAAAAQTTADQAKTLAGTADTKAQTAQDEIDALELIVYGAETNKPKDKTILQLIEDAKTESTYDDEEVRGLISQNTSDITELKTAVAGKAAQSEVNDLTDRVEANEIAIAGINTKLGTVPENNNLVDMIADAKKAGTDATDALNAYKESNNSKITEIEAKNETQDTEIGKKADKTALEELSKTVSDDKAAQDALIQANKTAIENLTKEGGPLAGIQEDIDKNASDITDLNTRLSTAEGTLKTAVEITIPDLTSRVKTLEDGMDGYVTDGELTAESTRLSGLITAAQNQADKGVSDAAAANLAAQNAQNDATSALNQLEAIKDSQTIDSFADVEAAITASFAANDAMVFKGVLGTEDGQVANLPSDALSGHTYKVAKAGTYAGKEAQIGDLFINLDGEWKYVPSGNEDQDVITIKGDTTATVTLGSNTEVTNGSVQFVGGDSVQVVGTAPDADKKSTITISMVWGTF